MSDQPMSVDRAAIKAALATLSDHLNFECTEVDAQGRYVLGFDAMNEIVDAIDEIEEAFDEGETETGE